MGQRTAIHEQVLSAKNAEDLNQAYGAWASSYDDDLIHKWNYQGPAATVKWVTYHWPDLLPREEADVLDAGCGTGLVGVALHGEGFRLIHGLDYSADMLEQARAKGFYQSLEQVDLNQPLKTPNDYYDLVTCVGTFTSAHVRPAAIHELLRVTKSGGLVALTVRETYWREAEFAETLRRVQVDGSAVVLEMRTEPYIPTEGSMCKLLVLMVK